MHHEVQRLTSAILGHEVELRIFGHAGAPLIAFPTSLAPVFEWEDRSMVGMLAEPLEQGWNQLFCVQTFDADNLYARGTDGRAWRPPHERIARYAAYQQFLSAELVPYLHSRNSDRFLIAAGASFGAFHAVNFACRNPGVVRRVIGMSGKYDLRPWLDGHFDDNVYFNNPVDYLSGAHEPEQLARLRQELDIILTAGTAAPETDDNRRFSQILWDRAIWHALRWWDGFAHDWPFWKDQIRMYLNGA
jgi:esterase/lipase superfamily enzyme